MRQNPSNVHGQLGQYKELFLISDEITAMIALIFFIPSFAEVKTGFKFNVPVFVLSTEGSGVAPAGTRSRKVALVTIVACSIKWKIEM